ncbi:hypothetical protein ACQ4PT_046457 [Festuca glaucescens]
MAPMTASHTPVEHDASRPGKAHREAPREADAKERGAEARGHDHLEDPVELALHAAVGRGVEVENQELLREDDGHEEEAQRAAARGAGAVEVDGGARVDDEREADDGVLVVVEAVGRDGAVGVERQERRVVHEHLHDELHGAAGDDEGRAPGSGAPVTGNQTGATYESGRREKSLTWLKRCHRPTAKKPAPGRMWPMLLRGVPPMATDRSTVVVGARESRHWLVPHALSRMNRGAAAELETSSSSSPVSSEHGHGYPCDSVVGIRVPHDGICDRDRCGALCVELFMWKYPDMHQGRLRRLHVR